MKFNVAKCHSVSVTRHLTDKQYRFDYSLHQQICKEVQSAIYMYLVITITNNLNQGQLISEITANATRTLGFLWRNLAFAPRQTKNVAYKTLSA